MRFVHIQRLFGLFAVEPRLNVGEIIAKRLDVASLSNVVRIQTRHLVGTSEPRIAKKEGRLTGKIIDHAITTVALLNHGNAVRNNGFHGGNRFVTQKVNAMTVVLRHVDVRWVLVFRVSETVADTETGEFQRNCLGSVRLVAPPDTVRNGWSIVASVTFTHNVERTGLVLRISLEKGLQEIVGILGYHLFVGVSFLSVRKPYTGGLIQPQNVRCFRPRRWVDRGRFILVDRAGTILGQESQSGRAAGPTRQPNDKRRIIGNFTAFFKHPKEQVLVFFAIIVLGSFNVHVSRQARGGIVAQVRLLRLRNVGLEFVLLRSDWKEVFAGELKDLFIAVGGGGGGRWSDALKDSFGQQLGLIGRHAFRWDRSSDTPLTGRTVGFCHLETSFFVGLFVANGICIDSSANGRLLVGRRRILFFDTTEVLVLGCSRRDRSRRDQKGKKELHGGGGWSMVCKSNRNT